MTLIDNSEILPALFGARIGVLLISVIFAPKIDKKVLPMFIGETSNYVATSSNNIIDFVKNLANQSGSLLWTRATSNVYFNSGSVGIGVEPNNYKFEVANALNSNEFEPESFTHILCMYFTIYYIDDKKTFFDNCFKWLMRGGYLIIHLVDRELFDPILPPGNPLLYISPQRYAKERITSTKVKFNEFDYTSDFDLDNESGIARFNEKFQFENGKVRKQEHKLYMEPEKDIITRARDLGFIIQGQVDLLNCGYEYQYLYILMKP
jgi:SAM-dependent methyltransferase